MLSYEELSITNWVSTLKCFKRSRAQEVTIANRQARLKRARQLLKRFSRPY